MKSLFDRDERKISDAISRVYPDHLSDDERARSHALLREYISTHQPYHEVQSVVSARASLSHILGLLFSPHSAYATPVLASLFVFLLGGTITLAERSVPGDLFYGFKVAVNEPAVSAILSYSDENAANWDIALAERRLKESTTLAITGELDEETRTALTKDFVTHVANATRRMGGMREGGRESASVPLVAARLSSIVATHDTVNEAENEPGGVIAAAVAPPTPEMRVMAARAPEDAAQKGVEVGMDAPVPAASFMTKSVDATESDDPASIAAIQIEAAEVELRSTPDLTKSQTDQTDALIKSAKESKRIADADMKAGRIRNAYDHYADALAAALSARALLIQATSSGEFINPTPFKGE